MLEWICLFMFFCFIGALVYLGDWVWLKIQDIYANYKIRKLQNEKENNQESPDNW